MEVKDITWYGHASFKLLDKTTGNIIYYIDPFNFPTTISLEPADLIFVTHAHADHLSPTDIKKILKDDTVIILPADSIDKLAISNRKVAVLPNQEYNVRDVKFQTIPAYNNKLQRIQAHPKENNWVGYIFSVNGGKVYHAGDTDFIDEMKTLADLYVDIAMLPIGGTYTMDVEEAIEAANAIGAKITIPMHYRRLLGGAYKEAEEKFKKGVTKSEVIILEEMS